MPSPTSPTTFSTPSTAPSQSSTSPSTLSTLQVSNYISLLEQRLRPALTHATIRFHQRLTSLEHHRSFLRNLDLLTTLTDEEDSVIQGLANVGEEVYVRTEAEMKEEDMVVVDIGCGILVEMKIEEGKKWGKEMVKKGMEKMERAKKEVEELEAAIIVVSRGLEAAEGI